MTQTASGAPRVLVIDDTPAIHEDVHRILQAAPEDDRLAQLRAAAFGANGPADKTPRFRVDGALQGREGVELVRRAREQNDPYQVAFVDVRMPPGWDGLQTVEELWKLDPRVEVVICTAYSDHSWKEIIRRLGLTDRLLILRKPFDTTELRQLALALSRKWQLNRAAEARTDELEHLVEQRTQERTRLQEQLHQTQKLEAVGQLAHGIVHDLGNLLSVLGGCADALRKHALASEAGEALAALEQATGHARFLVNSLLTFARAEPCDKQPVDVAGVTRESARLLRHLLPRSIELQVTAPAGPVTVQANATQLQQIILNLAVNARDAMPEGGTLALELHAQPAAGTTRLCVSDTGCGMGPDVQSRMFDPFFTTKPRGQGTGLGLSVVQGIVRDHGGTIAVRSNPGEGTRITVELPLAPQRACLEAGAPAVARGRGEMVFLVEPARHVRELLTAALRAFGYRVVAAESLEALAAAASIPELWIVAIGDRAAEQMAAARRAARGRPLLLLGDPGMQAGHDNSEVAVLTHPFTMSELGAQVNRMLEPEPVPAGKA